MHEYITRVIPGVTLRTALGGAREYDVRRQLCFSSLIVWLTENIAQVPKNAISLESVFQEMETHKKALHISDWAITNTTLEEVFLRVSMEGSGVPQPATPLRNSGKKGKASQRDSGSDASEKSDVDSEHSASSESASRSRSHSRRSTRSGTNRSRSGTAGTASEDSESESE